MRYGWMGVCLAAGLWVAQAPAQAQAKPVTMILNWLINPTFGPLIVAQEKGFFTQAGVEVELIEPSDAADAIKLLAAGQVDTAILYQPQLHLAVDQGLPVVRIATLSDAPLNVLLVAADGPIRNLADLRGKKIASSYGLLEKETVRYMLARHGVTMAEVEWIEVNFNLAQALLSRQADAISGAFRTVEPQQLELEGMPVRIFYPEEEGIPPYDELIIATSRDKLQDPRLPRLIAAVERGALYMTDHPEEGWQLLIKGRPELDNEANRRSWDASLSRFSLSPAALARGRYQTFAKYLLEQKMIAQIPPLDSYAVELPAP